jgi:hypothetical protein
MPMALNVPWANEKPTVTMAGPSISRSAVPMLPACVPAWALWAQSTILPPSGSWSSSHFALSAIARSRLRRFELDSSYWSATRALCTALAHAAGDDAAPGRVSGVT